MGGGKSSGSSAPVVTQEQKDLLKAQTGFLTETALPTYVNTIGGAQDIYNRFSPITANAAANAIQTGQRTGRLQEATGAAGLTTGMAGLAGLFDPNYENQQVQAALQAGRESARESQAGQNAMYGAAGGLGSSRMALADANLSSLNAQRQATAAAQARAGVQANKAAAAQALMGAGQAGLTGAQQSAASLIGYAGAPADLYSKYAAVVYGTPQASTSPNFQGTQGQTTSGKGSGLKIGG
jgi:hypothetical protein